MAGVLRTRSAIWISISAVARRRCASRFSSSPGRASRSGRVGEAGHHGERQRLILRHGNAADRHRPVAVGVHHRGGPQRLRRLRLEQRHRVARGAAADEGEDLVWGRRHQAGGAYAGVACMDDLRGSPDQHVGVPDGRHAMFGYGLDANGDRAGPEIDRRKALRLGEREKWIGHQVLRIPRREVARERTEEVELLAPWSSSGRRRHVLAPREHQRRSRPA